jgi:hypothetical protein
LNPNDILVSVGNSIAGSFEQINTVYEFSPSGTLVQSIPFSYNGASYPATEYLRDIIVAPDGNLYGYNGTFSPYLTGYSPLSNTFTNTTAAQWSSVNGTHLGGIGAYQNYIFATDMMTFNGGEANGIVRFDLSSHTSTRFGIGTDYGDLSLGLDGKVYAVPEFSSSVSVFNPVTMAPVRTVSLAVSGAITIDQLGRFFVANGSTIYRLNSSGAIELSLDTHVNGGGFADIDVDADGNLVACQDNGQVVLTTANLTSFTTFQAVHDPNAIDWTVFVSFARPVPEPDSATLVVLSVTGFVALYAWRRWRTERGRTASSLTC